MLTDAAASGLWSWQPRVLLSLGLECWRSASRQESVEQTTRSTRDQPMVSTEYQLILLSVEKSSMFLQQALAHSLLCWGRGANSLVNPADVEDTDAGTGEHTDDSPSHKVPPLVPTLQHLTSWRLGLETPDRANGDYLLHASLNLN